MKWHTEQFPHATELTKASGRFAPGIVASNGSWGVLSIAPDHLPKANNEPKPKAKRASAKRKVDDSNTEGTASKRTKKASKSKDSVSSAVAGKDNNGLIDVSAVYLDGEEDECVPVYATAADIRRQLTALIAMPGVTQAGICRSISAYSGTPVTAAQLSSFRAKGKKGGASVHGADSPAFYAAYVYFEKLRVLQGGKKSKHRLDMEDAWGQVGMSGRGLKPMWSICGQSLTYDSLGRLLVDGRVSPSNFTSL